MPKLKTEQQLKVIMTLFMLFIFTDLIIAQEAVQCERIEKPNPESEIDPILVETCIHDDLKVISVGEPDSKGRYFWDRKLFRVSQDSLIEINTADLFENNAQEVGRYLNDQLKDEYEENLKQRGESGCMSRIDLKNYELSDFLPELSRKSVVFRVDYDLGGACLPVSVGHARMTYAKFDSLRNAAR